MLELILNIMSLQKLDIKVPSRWRCMFLYEVAFRGFFSTLRPRGPIVFLPQQVPAFISRGTTHHTDARDLYQRRPVGLNLQKSRWDFLHAAKLGHGTYYFTFPPKEGILRIFRMPEKSNGFGRV
jgi:hypothetical protein